METHNGEEEVFTQDEGNEGENIEGREAEGGKEGIEAPNEEGIKIPIQEGLQPEEEEEEEELGKEMKEDGEKVEEREEDDEEEKPGMWQETFKTHHDSKPYGNFCVKHVYTHNAVAGQCLQQALQHELPWFHFR